MEQSQFPFMEDGSTFSPVELRVKTFRPQDYAVARPMGREVRFVMILFDSLPIFARVWFSGKTCWACYLPTADGIFAGSFQKLKHAGIVSGGACLTRNIPAWTSFRGQSRNADGVYGLSAFLDNPSEVSPKSFLTRKALSGMFRRAESRGGGNTARFRRTFTLEKSCVYSEAKDDVAPCLTVSGATGGGIGVGSEILILEPDHLTFHTTARALVGEHDARINDRANLVWQNNRLRRLTPTECERLMGYPVDYTKVPYRGRPADACPPTPRYEACGNGWAINCARWILLGIHDYLIKTKEGVE